MSLDAQLQSLKDELEKKDAEKRKAAGAKMVERRDYRTQISTLEKTVKAQFDQISALEKTVKAQNDEIKALSSMLRQLNSDVAAINASGC